jgi:hypothetical protein
MMQAAGRPLTIYEIRRALIGSVDPHPGPAGLTSTRLGYGYLNPAAAVAAARRLRGTSPGSPAAASREDVESAESAYAPIWVEDAESAAEIEMPFAIESEAEEDCGCAGHTRAAAPEEVAALEADGEDWEAEPIEEFETAADEIATPFVWEDVRDALDAVDESAALENDA